MYAGASTLSGRDIKSPPLCPLGPSQYDGGGARLWRYVFFVMFFLWVFSDLPAYTALALSFDGKPFFVYNTKKLDYTIIC
jgi:hypothetical protein